MKKKKKTAVPPESVMAESGVYQVVGAMFDLRHLAKGGRLAKVLAAKVRYWLVSCEETERDYDRNWQAAVRAAQAYTFKKKVNIGYTAKD